MRLYSNFHTVHEDHLVFSNLLSYLGVVFVKDSILHDRPTNEHEVRAPKAMRFREAESKPSQNVWR